MRVISQPSFGIPLGSLLNDALLCENRTFSRVKAAVAYVKRSGVQHIAAALKKFITNGGTAEFAIGIDQGGTTAEGLNQLLEIIENNGRIFINHDENPYVTPQTIPFRIVKAGSSFRWFRKSNRRRFVHK
jgi:Fe-S cluster assembly iron-binding protein IscA